jgi:hypothetical protein
LGSLAVVCIHLIGANKVAVEEERALGYAVGDGTLIAVNVELIVVILDGIGVPTAATLQVEGGILDLGMDTEVAVEPADDRETAGTGWESGLDLDFHSEGGRQGISAVLDVDNILGVSAVGKEKLAVGNGLGLAIVDNNLAMLRYKLELKIEGDKFFAIVKMQEK